MRDKCPVAFWRFCLSFFSAIPEGEEGIGDELTRELDRLGFGVTWCHLFYSRFNGNTGRKLSYTRMMSVILVVAISMHAIIFPPGPLYR